MNEERLLILNMLRDGKLTPEQADSLLRALRDPEPRPASAPPPPAADPSTLASVQAKLADLQNKIGEIQGKQVADRAARIAGHAASFAGKVIGQIPRPEVDFRKALDETLSGLNSLMDDAVKTAKQAATEAKRLAKEGKKAVVNGAGAVTLNETFSDAVRRPTPGIGDQTALEAFDTSNTFSGNTITIVNRLGDINVSPGDDYQVAIKGEKTAWAASESEARVLLQQVFVTNRLENGNYRIDLVAPVDGRDRVTVDLNVRIPRGVACEVETNFGDVKVDEVSTALTVRSTSGDINASNPTAAPGDTRLATRSGSIKLTAWKGVTGSITTQTVSGDIDADGIGSTGDIMLHSQSGDIQAGGIEAMNALTVESISGDIGVRGGSVSTQATVKTQSGEIAISALRAGQIHVESVSGDAAIDDVGGALTVKTVSGDIDARSVNSYSAAVNTVSGDARFAFAAPHSGSFAGTSVSGDITLELWPNSDTRLNAASTSGVVKCTLPVEDVESPDPRHFSGALGSGSGSVRLQSISGDLAIVEPSKSDKKRK
jgi:DUF4097 and DUF4098 domain-containing protein YvlB